MKIILALAVMLSINMFLFLGQISVDYVAVNELATTSGSQFFDYEGSTLSDYDSGDYVLNSSSDLPEAEGSISPDTGNFFIDPIGSLKGWFSGVSQGVSYFKGIISAVPNFLKSIGLPKEVSFALGFFWHSLTLFLAVMLIWGRQL